MLVHNTEMINLPPPNTPEMCYPSHISQQFSEFRTTEEVFSPRIAAKDTGSRMSQSGSRTQKGSIMTAKNELLSQLEH